MSLLGRWWHAARPRSLWAPIVPVLVGSAAALQTGALRPLAALGALVACALIQVGVNLVNDYFDFVYQADPPIGVGNRALQRGVLAPRSFLAGGIGAFVVGSAIGIGLTLATTPWILVIGVVGVLLGFFYTAPPLKLGYHGLGEVIVFILLGPLAVIGGATVAAGTLQLWPLALSLPIGFLVAAILHANNLRDLDADRAAGKWTIAARIGACWAGRELALLNALPFVVVAVDAAVYGQPLLVITFLAVPRAVPLVADSWRRSGDPRDLMRRTGLLHRDFGLLLALGIALGVAWHL